MKQPMPQQKMSDGSIELTEERKMGLYKFLVEMRKERDQLQRKCSTLEETIRSMEQMYASDKAKRLMEHRELECQLEMLQEDNETLKEKYDALQGKYIALFMEDVSKQRRLDDLLEGCKSPSNSENLELIDSMCTRIEEEDEEEGDSVVEVRDSKESRPASATSNSASSKDNLEVSMNEQPSATVLTTLESTRISGGKALNTFDVHSMRQEKVKQMEKTSLLKPLEHNRNQSYESASTEPTVSPSMDDDDDMHILV